MLTEDICCNCRWYQGVHESAGCAPCEIKKTMVLWTNSCKSIWLIPERLKIEEKVVKYIDFS